MGGLPNVTMRGLKNSQSPETEWDAYYRLVGKRVRVTLNRDLLIPVVREGVLLYADCWGDVRLRLDDGRKIRYTCVRGLAPA